VTSSIFARFQGRSAAFWGLRTGPFPWSREGGSTRRPPHWPGPFDKGNFSGESGTRRGWDFLANSARMIQHPPAVCPVSGGYFSNPSGGPLPAPGQVSNDKLSAETTTTGRAALDNP